MIALCKWSRPIAESPLNYGTGQQQPSRVSKIPRDFPVPQTTPPLSERRMPQVQPAQQLRVYGHNDSGEAHRDGAHAHR